MEQQTRRDKIHLPSLKPNKLHSLPEAGADEVMARRLPAVKAPQAVFENIFNKKLP